MAKRIKFLILISQLILWAKDQGIELICVDFDRSQAEQDKDVLAGKSWTKESLHLIWQAMDLAVVEENNVVNFSNDYGVDYEKYQKLGDYWVTLDPNCVWGAGNLPSGKKRDVYHFGLR